MASKLDDGETAAAGKTCDLCDGSNFEPLAARDRHGKPLKTVICKTCGLVAHAHVPTEQQLAEFYGSEYRQQYHGEIEPSPRRVMRAWRNGRRILDQLQPFLKSGEDVFEVGAGIGCTVKQFELQGFTASGIEPHEGFQQYSQQRLHADVRRESLFDQPIASSPPSPPARGASSLPSPLGRGAGGEGAAEGPHSGSRPSALGPWPLPVTPTPLPKGEGLSAPAPARYDLILLVHVIEHFRSPRQALEQLHSLLKPGGKLYVECPNLDAPFARWSRLFHFAHIHNFTPATLKMLARRCGFDVIERFGRDDDPNLQMLLQRIDEPSLSFPSSSSLSFPSSSSLSFPSSSLGTKAGGELRLEIDPHSYQQTLNALEKSRWRPYHFRWRYLQQRAGQLAGYLAEYLVARWYTQRVLLGCAQASPPATAPANRRRAA